MKNRIYLDHNAATPVDPRVIEAVVEHLSKRHWNPSSVHAEGRETKLSLVKARDAVAAALGVHPNEILFTSGATEGANFVIRGLLEHGGAGHVITSNVEHSCVRNTINEMVKIGINATFLETGLWGAVTPEAVQEALRPDTKLIAIMAANNETGVKNPIREIAAIALQAEIPFFVDGAALLGKEKFSIPEGISAMTFSGQKIHAIQGSGFCFIRRGLKPHPLMTGGAQEFGRRAGTENLPGIVSLGRACQLMTEELPEAEHYVAKLRERFETELRDALPDIEINGEGPRVVSTSNIFFPGVNGETLLTALDLAGVAASHGSACSSGALEPSKVLINMGLSAAHVDSSLRFSFSRMTTVDEIDRACGIIIDTVKKLSRVGAG